ncbi:golgin subfamily A member 6-like protein 24 isoform X2 [Zophobas morio]|uniref:golgin subfamily A member 6-like protein 24 isoform X2 n=1 Tax=Zophobas morio TaxID=2755281 RepID=UPI0030828518
MTTLHQEIVPNSEHEAHEADRSSQESSCEATKELFRRDLSPKKDEPIPPLEPPEFPIPAPTTKTTSKPIIKASLGTKELTQKKKSNSGIPLRLKSGANPAKSPKSSSYRHSTTSGLPVINRNTLEVQFMNNKKRLMQLHSELIDRQRPLQEMHKSLMRTKKQLEELGKKVVLEDLKIISLKVDDSKMSGAGENPANEAVTNLRSSIESALDTCMKACNKCFTERDQVFKMFESSSKSAVEISELDAGVEELKKKEENLEKTMQVALNESEKKIQEALDNWQKTIKMKIFSNEAANKISTLEDTVKHQQKLLHEAEDNLHSVTRKYEDKKATYEKTITEMQEKYTKLEDEMKRERKAANDNLMKSRNMRGKMTDIETKAKEAEEKSSEAMHKLKQVQEQMRRKEIQWMKEKDEFKKNEALLQQKFTEKQNQFDTRLKDMETMQKSAETQQQTCCRNFETQLEIKAQEYALLEKEKDAISARSKQLEEQVEELKRQLDDREKELDEMSIKMDNIPAIEYKPSETHFMELMDYKQKVTDTQKHIEHLNDQVTKMQSSLKAHAKLAAALKLEKDNAIKYSAKLREVLHEAKEELEYKNKTIYKIHEKLVLKDKAFDKLKAQMKELEACSEFSGEKWGKNRCQICMATMGEEKTEHPSCVETEI